VRSTERTVEDSGTKKSRGPGLEKKQWKPLKRLVIGPSSRRDDVGGRPRLVGPTKSKKG